MKRIILAGAALCGALGFVAATPARADEPTHTADNTNLVAAIVNPVLSLIPAPEGWKQRSICVGSDQANKAWCLYFPWPT